MREKVPPGYKDRDKDDPTGDYLVWRQLMDEAKIRKLPVVFITDDSRSDDWYRREHGMTLGARHELREEMYREAGVPLLMMTTRTFLLHAKTYLNAKVSKETVEQARELPAALDERLAVYHEVRASLLQDLEKLREARLAAERETRHAARNFGILAGRFSEAQRDAPTLGDASLAEAEADLRRAHDARAAAEDKMATLATRQHRVEGLLELLERESEAQGVPFSLLEQVHREMLARRQARLADQRATGQ